MIALEKLLKKQSDEAGVKGTWFVVRWTPDPFAGETLNIGVGFLSSDGSSGLKLLDDFTRLECLFDTTNISFHATLACEIVAEALAKNCRRRGALYANVSVQDQGFAQGEDVDSIVAKLYREAVSLGRKKVSSRRKMFAPVSRDDAYKKIRSQLKNRLELQFEGCLPNNPYKEVKDVYGSESLYLPFQKPNAVATLATAAYADVYRVKSHLWEGFRSIDTALQKGIAKSAALFLVLPDESMPKSAGALIEREVETFYAYLQRHSIPMESHVDVEALASSVGNWCLAEAG